MCKQSLLLFLKQFVLKMTGKIAIFTDSKTTTLSRVKRVSILILCVINMYDLHPANKYWPGNAKGEDVSQVQIFKIPTGMLPLSNIFQQITFQFWDGIRLSYLWLTAYNISKMTKKCGVSSRPTYFFCFEWGAFF